MLAGEERSKEGCLKVDRPEERWFWNLTLFIPQHFLWPKVIISAQLGRFATQNTVQQYLSTPCHALHITGMTVTDLVNKPAFGQAWCPFFICANNWEVMQSHTCSKGWLWAAHTVFIPVHKHHYSFLEPICIKFKIGTICSIASQIFSLIISTSKSKIIP